MSEPLCPAYSVLRLLSGKWKPAILYHLREGSLRFGDLRRSLPGVSQKMLTAQLRELEADGVVVRSVMACVPPRVDYALSSLGLALLPLLQQMDDFVQENREFFPSEEG